jgi:hypothetical protein
MADEPLMDLPRRLSDLWKEEVNAAYRRARSAREADHAARGVAASGFALRSSPSSRSSGDRLHR